MVAEMDDRGTGCLNWARPGLKGEGIATATGARCNSFLPAKLVKIAVGFLPTGKAEKRRLAMRQASFDNEACW